LENSIIHLHFICTGYVAKAPDHTKVRFVNRWFKKLVKAIDMNILFPPKSTYSDTVGNEGLSGIVGIDTSHSSIHFWSNPRPYFKFDLYSCKPFDKNKVIEMLREFDMYEISYTLIDRTDDSNPVVSSGHIIFK
jgi:S-adenosylmethionine/arginine decarboxylase-like enzyme